MRCSRPISVLAMVAAGLLSTSAMVQARGHDPLPGHTSGHIGAYLPQYNAPSNSTSGTWAALAHSFPGSGFPDTALQLTDGTVLMHDGCTVDWYKLTPDNNGSYHNGTWTKLASGPSGYSPLYFASQVLPDGRVIVNGGEYLNCNSVWTTKGALYDPVANTWTNVSPPSGWAHIGDAQSMIRTDGHYMVANCCSTQEAIATISGTTVTWTSTGTGKADSNDEEGWTQVPGQTISTVDANINLGGAANTTELYSEGTGIWTPGNPTANSCVDAGSHEIGPAPLLPNGLVFQLCGTPHTDVFDPLTGAYTAGPDMPNIGGTLDSADGPAAVLPDGNILAQVSPGVYATPSHFVEIQVKDATHVSITQVSEPASAASQSSYEGRLLILPTGEVLWSSDVGDVQIYTPKGKTVKAAVPKIKKIAKTVTVGSSNNKITGFGFNGLTFGGYYGDDAQMSTNYPLVRFTNNSTGHVCYARTHDHQTSGLSDGSLTGTKFDVPATCETGASKAQVVVNGIASKAKAVTLN